MRFQTRIWALLGVFFITFVLLSYLSSRPKQELHVSLKIDEAVDQRDLNFHPQPVPWPALRDPVQSPVCTQINGQVTGTKTYFANQLLGEFDRRYFPGIKTFEHGVQVPNSLKAGSGKPNGGKLTVYIVPHSHNDPNWVKPYASYYQQQTRGILNSALKYLVQWPDMRFIWTETVFLSTWWGEATPAQRATLKSLVSQGRLEIAGGGWVSPDEATTHHFGLINQMLDGHLWVQEHLGVSPETYWNVDPFGYSLMSPYLLRQAGVKNYVILRINEHLKDMLRHDRALEFNWQSFWSSQEGGAPDSKLLTSLLPFMMYQIKYSCGPNPQFCLFFDFRIIDGEISESAASGIDERNLNRLSEMLFQQLEAKSKFYRHNVVLMPLGDDFRWDREEEWHQQYSNYKKLMTFMNKHKTMNIELKFGTLKDYFAAVRAQLQVDSLPHYVGDFYTYTDRDEDYWSGYFTSRPGLKRCGRDMEALLRAAEIFAAATVTSADAAKVSLLYPQLEWARRNLSLFQHHDSITGTSIQEVVDEQYVRRLLPGTFNNSVSVLAAVLADMAGTANPPEYTAAFESWRSPPRLPLPRSPPTPPRHLLLVNSLGRARYDCATVTLRGPASTPGSLHLRASESSAVLRCQVEPHIDGISGGISEAEFDILVCLRMPPYSVTRVDVRVSSTALADAVRCPPVTVAMNFAHHSSAWSIQRLPEGPRRLALENSRLKLGFSLETGEFDSVGVTTPVGSGGGGGGGGGTTTVFGFGLQFGFYQLTKGHHGAYIMAEPVDPSAPLSREGFQEDTVVYSVSGQLRSSIIRQQNRYRSRMALYSTGDPAMDAAARLTNWAQLPSSDGTEAGKHAPPLNLELVMRANLSLANTRYFYTDANSAALVRRHRPVKAPFASGIYPVTGAAVLLDPGRLRVTLLAAQSHGVALLPDGRLDVLLHRRTSHDDNRGVGQGIQQVYPARSDFLLLWSPGATDSAGAASASNDERLAGDFLTVAEQALSRRLNYRPLVFWADALRPHPAPAPVSVQLLSELPCTLEIVTYRLLPPGHAYQALLVLHNHPASLCGRAEQKAALSASEICSPTNSGDSAAFSLGRLFSGSGQRRPKLVAEATLTGLSVTRPAVSLDETIPLHGFFFRTYLLTF